VELVEGNRSSHALHAAVFEPLAGAVEQRLGDVGVVDRVEKAEKTGSVAVAIEVGPIDLSRDPTDAFVITERRKTRPVGVVEERVLFAQPIFELEVERANERRVVAIDVIDEIEERAQIAPERYRANVHGVMSVPRLYRRGNRSG
jgi:hypothetical protein